MKDKQAGDQPPHKHKWLRRIGIGVLALVLIIATGGFFAYRYLDGNIKEIPGPEPQLAKEPKGPKGPLNILLLGSDQRVKGGGVVGAGGDLSDTTILLHLAANRKVAYGVSIPRDLLVTRPACDAKKQGDRLIPGGSQVMFNSAFGVGGPACTVKTVHAMTGVDINHVVVVKFDGFKRMVDALGGVPVCVPKEINDPAHKIYLKQGSYDITGNEALTYVRARYGIGDGTDIGRIKRQQAFLASMVNKAMSLGTLTNPFRLFKFLKAVTKSIETDKDLASLKKLGALAKQLKNIGLKNVKFLTMPIAIPSYDINRRIPAPRATALWLRIKKDEPLTKAQLNGSTNALNPGGEPTGKPGKKPTKTPTDTAAQQAAEREAVGLCA